MLLREWDPSTATAGELAAVVETLNDVRATDLPADPPWCEDMVREYFATTLPGERRITWLASEGPEGAVHGHATLLLTDDIGVVELLVRPGSRGRGLGARLLATLAARAGREGARSLGVEVVGDTASVHFFERHGFRCAYTELRSVLKLSAVDWVRVAELAAGISAGYRVEYHAGGPPPEMYRAYATAKEAVRPSEYEDLDLRPSSYDPDRLAASVRTLHARGLNPHIVVAVHERTGAVAGLTEVVVPAQRPARADQYDTIVVPKHRGYGIARTIKARMLLELRAAEPRLVDVQTWNAPQHEQMLKLNSELGFRADRQWHEYEADVDDLIRRLPTP